ncbi:hypothetical protein ASG21_08510 [Chryseobacterium sp. Leaf394]|nr:hypothetical protein ASG21_08510 [Chryseobacterium sp. Leaf394]
MFTFNIKRNFGFAFFAFKPYPNFVMLKLVDSTQLMHLHIVLKKIVERFEFRSFQDDKRCGYF